MTTVRAYIYMNPQFASFISIIQPNTYNELRTSAAITPYSLDNITIFDWLAEKIALTNMPCFAQRRAEWQKLINFMRFNLKSTEARYKQLKSLNRI